MNLKHYISKGQLSALRACCQGEEGECFKEMLTNLKTQIVNMPVSRETDGQGMGAIVCLHYFSPSSDWWITERDMGSEEDESPGTQHQAFGYACLNGDTQNAELGYISIQELIENRVEIDLYWTPKPLKEVIV